jgi:hypothetical protein
MSDFVMDKSGSGAGFLRELRVSPADLHSICFSTIIFTITRGWHDRPGVAAVHKPNSNNNKKSLLLYYNLILLKNYIVLQGTNVHTGAYVYSAWNRVALFLGLI